MCELQYTINIKYIKYIFYSITIKNDTMICFCSEINPFGFSIIYSNAAIESRSLAMNPWAVTLSAFRSAMNPWTVTLSAFGSAENS